MKKKPDWTWPSGKRIAWSDGKPRIIDVPRHAHIFGHHRGARFYEKIIEEAWLLPIFGSVRANRSRTAC
jgi:hypothetical protein